MTLAQAARAAAVPPFHAMAMSRAAGEREAAGNEVLHLEVGQPSTPAPAGARQAAIASLERGEALGYTNAAGLMSLRRRIARHYDDWYGIDVSPNASGRRVRHICYGALSACAGQRRYCRLTRSGGFKFHADCIGCLCGYRAVARDLSAQHGDQITSA